MYSSGDQLPQRILTFTRPTVLGGLSLLSVIDVASPGSVLIHGLVPNELNGYFLVRPDEEPLPLLARGGNPTPVAINQEQTIAFIDYDSSRERLLLNGPGPGETLCPIPPRVEEIDCPADCNADGTVSVAEIITGVGIALGDRQSAECPVFDQDGNETVTVDELIGAVTLALQGCSAEPAGAASN